MIFQTSPSQECLADTHFLTTVPTLAHHHAGTSPKVSRHPRWHLTHASTPPTQAHRPRHPRQHKQHAISQTAGYPIKILKLLALKFERKFRVFTFSFYFYSSYFLDLLKHFHRSLENCHRKIKLFQRNLVCFIQKVTIFSKTNAQFFLEKNIS